MGKTTPWQCSPVLVAEGVRLVSSRRWDTARFLTDPPPPRTRPPDPYAGLNLEQRWAVPSSPPAGPGSRPTLPARTVVIGDKRVPPPPAVNRRPNRAPVRPPPPNGVHAMTVTITGRIADQLGHIEQIEYRASANGRGAYIALRHTTPWPRWNYPGPPVGKHPHRRRTRRRPQSATSTRWKSATTADCWFVGTSLG